MTRLHSFSKTLVCVMLAGGLTPAPADAKLPPPETDFNEQQQVNPARPPRVVLVAQDSVTVIEIFDCAYQQNVGACIDSAFAGSGTSLAAIDTNRIGRFLQGTARVSAMSGPRAIANANYSYDNLLIEGDIKIRAQE
ncbi:MAG TPA: hypothetical protein VGB85_06585 [Nannocystis sp.]